MVDKVQNCINLTNIHIRTVQAAIALFIVQLQQRARVHDASKLESPELEGYSEGIHALKDLEYGTPEYRQSLKEMKPAIDHHYSVNTHHPEYHGEKGISGMNLLDLVEMVCDWKAAGLRNKNGDLQKSIEINSPRFGMDPQLTSILLNSVSLFDQLTEEVGPDPVETR